MNSLNPVASSSKYVRLTKKSLETHIYISYMDRFNKEVMTQLYEAGLLSQNNEPVNLDNHIREMNNQCRKKRSKYIEDIRRY
jgi:hypothetical protein